MSIASRISSIETHLSNAYTSIGNKGVDLTNVDKNIANLSSKIDAIQTGGGQSNIKQAFITLSEDKTSGSVELTSADSDIAQHRTDTNFFVLVLSLNALDSSDRYSRMMFNGNRILSTASGGSNQYGGAVEINANGYGSITFITNAVTSSSARVYVDSSGKVIVKPASTRILKAGQYMVLCLW